MSLCDQSASSWGEGGGATTGQRSQFMKTFLWILDGLLLPGVVSTTWDQDTFTHWRTHTHTYSTADPQCLFLFSAAGSDPTCWLLFLNPPPDSSSSSWLLVTHPPPDPTSLLLFLLLTPPPGSSSWILLFLPLLFLLNPPTSCWLAETERKKMQLNNKSEKINNAGKQKQPLY